MEDRPQAFETPTGVPLVFDEEKDEFVPASKEQIIDPKKTLLEQIPSQLRRTLLTQAHMIVACLTTKPVEKLDALAQLRLQGLTHADAKKEVERILTEIVEANGQG